MKLEESNKNRVFPIFFNGFVRITGKAVTGKRVRFDPLACGPSLHVLTVFPIHQTYSIGHVCVRTMLWNGS